MLRILRTTSFRFTVIYVVLFAGAVAALGAYFYNATFGEAAKQTDNVIDSEIGVLADLFSTSGPGMLTRVIRQRTAWSDDAIYMLIGAPSGAVLAGNLTALPPEALTAEGDFFNFKFEKPLVDPAGREVGVQQREARGKMMRFRAAPDAEQSYLVVVARDVASREFLRQRSQSIVTRAALVTVAFGPHAAYSVDRPDLERIRTYADELEAKDEALRATIDDSEKLLATFNALLSIARIQSGEGAGVLKPIDIVAIAEEMAELYEPAAQDAGFDFRLITAPTPTVKGSRELVSQAVANFLDNALKYAEGGTRIELKVEPTKTGGAVLSVSDDGPGVKPADRDRIFERFVRLEASRSTPGSGLGLSLVLAIARAHNAKIELLDGIKHADGGGCGLRIGFEFADSPVKSWAISNSPLANLRKSVLALTTTHCLKLRSAFAKMRPRHLRDFQDEQSGIYRQRRRSGRHEQRRSKARRRTGLRGN
jgi:signal transduction histidine kinase